MDGSVVVDSGALILDAGITDSGVSSSIMDAGLVVIVDAGPMIVNVVKPMVPPSSEIELSKLLSYAVESKDAMALSAFLLMMVVWFVGKFVIPSLPKDKKDLIPAVSLGLAILTAAAASILNPGIKLHDSLITALMTSGAAGGFWSMIGKHAVNFMSSKTNPTPPEPPASETPVPGNSTDKPV